MTPTQERALLEATAKGLDDDIRQAFERLMQLIRDGVAPRDAVQQVMQSFSQDYAQLLSEALSGVMAMSIGAEAAMALRCRHGAAVRQAVCAVADRRSGGAGRGRAAPARIRRCARLALELFEGYAFRPPQAEPLQFKPSNPKLPKYLREALLSDAGMQGDMTRAFAKLQADNLKTGPCPARPITRRWRRWTTCRRARVPPCLKNALKTAFYERMRYFANRIARRRRSTAPT